MKFLIAAWTCLALLTGLHLPPAVAQPAEPQPEILVADAWIRAPALPQRPAALYFTLRNSGDMAQRLVAVRTDDAARSEIHNHFHDGGVMKMRRQDHVEIAPGETLAFKPGGLHVMLFEPAASVAAGATLTARLVFEPAGEVEITAPVRGFRDHGEGHGHQGH